MGALADVHLYLSAADRATGAGVLRTLAAARGGTTAVGW